MRLSLKQSLIVMPDNRSLHNGYRESALSGLSAWEVSFSRSLPDETILPKHPQGSLPR